MEGYLLSQIVMTLSAILTCISMRSKKKDKLIGIQIVQCIISAIANKILGANSAYWVNLAGAVRNIQVYAKFPKVFILISTFGINILLSVGTIFLKGFDIIDLLPVFATLLYTVGLVISDDVRTINIFYIIHIILWIMYNAIFNNLVAVIINLVTLVNSIHVLLKLKEKTKYSM